MKLYPGHLTPTFVAWSVCCLEGLVKEPWRKLKHSVKKSAKTSGLVTESSFSFRSGTCKHSPGRSRLSSNILTLTRPLRGRHWSQEYVGPLRRERGEVGELEGGKGEQICHGYWLYLNTSERCGRAMCIYRCILTKYRLQLLSLRFWYVSSRVLLIWSRARKESSSGHLYCNHFYSHWMDSWTGLFSMGSFRT